MSSLDAVQIIIIGAATGFGSALGTELARFLVTTIKEKKEKRIVNS
jgi:hypothetical protein